MKYYVSESGEIYAYESDGSQDDYIKDDLRPISDEELAQIRSEQDAPSLEQLARDADSQRDALLALATIRIAPLQDAYDLDEATADELASLEKWKKYRVLVNRVTAQAGFPTSIQWPVQPAQ